MTDLINRYVYAVTQKLPVRQRADIEMELRGLIEDMLEDRGAPGDTASREDVEQVLLELGPPNEMAARYRVKERYLIGPGLIDGYWSVLKIVIYSLVIFLSISYIIEYFSSTDSSGETLLEYFVTILSVSIHGFAWVTGIFAFIEYLGARTDKAKDWEPSQLEPVPDSATRIKPIEPLIGFFASILFFVVFTFSIEWIGVIRISGEQSFKIPVFDKEAFAIYLPFIWAVTAIGILKDTMKLILRKWTSQLVAIHLIFNIVFTIAAIVILSDPAILNPTFMNQLVDANLLTTGEESYNTVNRIWNQSREGLIYIIVIINLIDTVSVGMKWFRHKDGPRVLSK